MKATRTDIYQQQQTTNQLLQQIVAILLQQGAQMATNAVNLDNVMQNMTAAVANETTVTQSAITLISGFASNAMAAIQAARNNGDFGPLNNLVSALTAQQNNLAQAVAQNTAAEQELERIAASAQPPAGTPAASTPAAGGQAPTPSPADGSAPAATTAPADAGAGAAPAPAAGTAPADATGTSTPSAPADTGTPAPPTGAGGGGAQG